MLVLSRKKNESIIIGKDIEIHVLKISGKTVRLGISAPQDKKVIRGELAPYFIEKENKEDNKTMPSSPEPESTENEDNFQLVAEFELPFGDDDDRIAIGNPFVIPIGT